jgi:hypothetical protein
VTFRSFDAVKSICPVWACATGSSVEKIGPVSVAWKLLVPRETRS